MTNLEASSGATRARTRPVFGLDRTVLSTGIAITLAMVLGSLTLIPLTADRGYILLAGLTIIIIEALSMTGRWIRLTAWVVHVLQVLVLLGIAIGLGLSASHDLRVGGSWIQQLWRLYLQSSVTVQTEAAPLPADVGVRWLIVLLIGMVTILADILVITLESPVWAIAPLLTIYIIPALTIDHNTPWWTFVLMAVGYLGVLLAEQLALSRRWTRNLSADSASSRRRGAAGTALGGLGAGVAIPALALSLLLGSALPTFGSLDIDSARPRGSGPLQLTDPTIDLQKNLTQQSNSVVLRYSTTSRTGEYLRLASLTRVDSSGWHMNAVNLSQDAPTSVPGLNAASTRRTVSVQIGDFGSEYLPAPYAPLTAPTGDWAWDPTNLMVISTANDRTDATRGLAYSVTSMVPDPDLGTFSQAAAGTPADKGATTVPQDVPEAILKLTHSITATENTPVARAVAIQTWLRDPRRFQYSTTAPPGDGYQVLTNFLTRTHSGYCIHFASAMALMARIEGIPSRVSVGFLPGTQQGGRWSVKASNMHAWPELYFQGYGWVRFEPTAAVASAPAWSVENPDSVPSSSASAGTSVPSTQASSTPSPSASTSAPANTADSSTGSGIPWNIVWRIALAALVVVAIAVTPMSVRALRRHRRLAAGDPSSLVAGAWREVHDSWTDHGLVWPPGSPRQQFDAASHQLGEPGSEALHRLAMAEERARYARSLGDLGEVATDVDVVRRALRSRETPRTNLLARWLPASLWH
ncbi:transglutaminase TgpA family protein [Acidipropionibacterium virtanenii]|uniref:Protein-glutamine gamma-glutamyltransferase n=1 Tax=Acidipropionibacterium virtanenii TaxID=2057246 RepID=A0A344UVA7_9ACTN|nr:DUF3488 and transglutaminase-like domain-containing protein [Acidipropionibacterium virtanenii]AXE39205.1 Protein-glutamine gamma-glutamyltransferase [Acidipropionibacterium virtanenii]